MLRLRQWHTSIFLRPRGLCLQVSQSLRWEIIEPTENASSYSDTVTHNPASGMEEALKTFHLWSYSHHGFGLFSLNSDHIREKIVLSLDFIIIYGKKKPPDAVTFMTNPLEMGPSP